ncbi:putative beta-adaptin [Trypanosoma cruzi]|uniref:AP complex subunit beta n=1 Tax=Trypanosoma cruzi (strain CL Brener) TaxID=353153 RepID=Q4DIK0_TRYCC|nr:beta-adaptin, putative [Trypanosoma cruzi]EAN92339.1 beta-adaptin, putative [Trypanosoma cruzi]RNC48172.1 putative beta-adaptin [Trypanosoma cruzi]|eukprot:XP_814190.1 beta-adaptin [Trypanosoma cruzi strain CL Brener]
MASMSSNTPVELRSEVNELRQGFRDPQIEKNLTRKRELLRKVIALMTMGVDTSSLFTEMILACGTTDIVSKKLIYFYLISRSENNAELALLSINTLTKECGEESPLVRGLALRSLASLRLPQLFVFLIPAVKKGFSDVSAHVRKTACLCALKVFRISPVEFHKQRFFERMLGMLRDSDSLVCCNALAVLVEVSRDAEANGTTEGVFEVTKPILYYLLNKLRSVPEWHQAQIINLVLRYTPTSEEEMFDIMNLLEERLQSNNSDLILSASNVFFYLTQNYPAVYRQVFDRLKLPLLSLLSSCSKMEVSYVVLCHIKLLVQREPRVFQDSYRVFYCLYMEPTYVKAVKIEILSMLATEASSTDILEEFAAYALERDKAVRGAAIEAMGKVALRLPCTAQKVLQHFLLFLESDSDHVRGKSLAVMQNYLRKYRDIEVVRPFLDALVRVYHEMNFVDEDSRVALVWVLGELGEHIEDAPYILEVMCNENLLAEPPEFRLQFLTSAVKLFFKRPPEMQPVLGTMFKLLINDFSHADVHDQALLYHRLLRQNLMAANKIICGPMAEIKYFVEEQNAALRDKLFEEFDTLSVVYYQTSDSFMKPSAAGGEEEDEEEDEDEEEQNDEEHAVNEGMMSMASASREAQEPNGMGFGWQRPVLGLMDSGFELSEDPSIEPHEFQRRWGALGEKATSTLQLQLQKVPDTETFEEGLEECGIITLASGAQGDAQKYYLYAQEEGDDTTYFMIELFLHKSGSVNITVKSDNPHMPQFLLLVKRIMEQF